MTDRKTIDDGWEICPICGEDFRPDESTYDDVCDECAKEGGLLDYLEKKIAEIREAVK
jgi:predicted amidophosphoribosyltransferase